MIFNKLQIIKSQTFNGLKHITMCQTLDINYCNNIAKIPIKQIIVNIFNKKYL